jgi:hypothetical protein
MDVEEQKFLIEENEKDVENRWERRDTERSTRAAHIWVTTCAILYGIATTIFLVKSHISNSNLPVPYCKYRFAGRYAKKL